MTLVLLDGPDYRLRRRDTVLVTAADRDEQFSASAWYARRLAGRARGLPRPVLGAGPSLGALALLHCHWRHPGAFDALLLQSASFFNRRTAAHEREFRRFGRIERFVRAVLSGLDEPPRIPLTITCGRDEENLAANREVAAALAARGWDVRFVEHRGGHEWKHWRRLAREELPLLEERV